VKRIIDEAASRPVNNVQNVTLFQHFYGTFLLKFCDNDGYQIPALKEKEIKRYEHYFKTLSNKRKQLEDLSDNYMNSTVGNKDKLLEVMEGTSYLFSINRQSLGYNILAITNSGKRINQKELESLRVHFSIASHVAEDDGSEETADFRGKIKCFLKIYQNMLAIQQKAYEIYSSGYIYNFESAFKEISNDQTSNGNPLRINLDYSTDSFRFSIRLPQQFNRDFLTENFQIIENIIRRIEEQIQKKALQLLTSQEHYWLTNMHGAQYRVLIRYLDRNQKTTKMKPSMLSTSSDIVFLTTKTLSSEIR
jgi:hypothetical protein